MATSRVHRLAAVGFENGAKAYELARPSYPQAAVSFVTDRLLLSSSQGPRHFLDLAAGTGKWTVPLVRELASREKDGKNHHVTAVEPVYGMRHQLERNVEKLGLRSNLTVKEGVAETLPFAGDGAIDGVTVAQAFHWFDPAKALREIHRVLKPDGLLAIIYNVKDNIHTDWIQKLDVIVNAADPSVPKHVETREAFPDWIRADGGFTPEVEMTRFEFVHRLTPELLVARCSSLSFVGSLPAPEREDRLERVFELTQTHEALRGKEIFDMPYTTEVWTVRKKSKASETIIV